MKILDGVGHQMSTRRSSRRTVLKAAAGAMAVSGVPLSAFAAGGEQALGNYPDGVKGDSAFVGIVVPLTGPYSAEGVDEQKGYELAIAQLNEGAEQIRKISPLTKKGVLGKTIKYGIADGKTNPDAAVHAAAQFLSNDKAIMVTGGVSSAVAVALEHLLDREKTLLVVNFGSSNAVMGKDCQRYAFRMLFSAYSIAKALAPVAAQYLGRNRKAAYLAPDYTYGHTLTGSTKEFMEKEGWKTAGVWYHPLGAADFSSYLINIANSGADTFVSIDYGADATNSIKQAAQFGLLKKMKLVVPQMSPFLPDAVGAETYQGALGVWAFWWTLQDKYPMVRDFVSEFQKKYGSMPQGTAYLAYLNMALWADAVERAGTFYPPDVIKAYEKEVKRTGLVGDVWFRAADHQGIFNFPVTVGKKPADMKGPKDFCDVLTVVDGSKVVQPVGLFGCKLGSYT